MNTAKPLIFVTGTDTEIGKTFVSRSIIRALVAKNKRVAGLKPIASDAQRVQGVLQNEDALELQKASNLELSYEQVNPICFEPAIAPHIAADLVGQQLNGDVLTTNLVVPEEADCVIIEGAGGWLTPLNQQETYADWVESQGFEVILVVGMKLGCLNHAMLTVRDIERRGLKLVGWVANFAQGEMNKAEDNLHWLKQNIPAPCLGIVPFQESPDCADKVAELLDISALT
ncbi:dethiobiotin synthase [Kangiella spongicola]|uniref:ATP-dependent dethiobiotin synthetase BioD n=1 Tax=Kangiella spongicola TaxID=796379 RepID=A0A318D3I4_9GAMM|nr:dethiobiotin synthase [Kangiella spongicola]PXF63866.1 dethiobiotin synthase [Kangiella spongicola]